MRIVGGRFGGRHLHGIKGDHTRPTMDRTKEALFNMLGPLQGEWCLDLYGGSGALAIEAVSRGIRSAVICEQDRAAIKTIQQNIAITKEADAFTLLKGSNRHRLSSFIAQNPTLRFDYVFIDPPYQKAQYDSDIQWLEQLGVLTGDSILILEADKQLSLKDHYGAYTQFKLKQYGQSQIGLYQRS